jgi:hypothetical protein
VFVFDKSIAAITKSDDELTDSSLRLDSFRINAQATLSRPERDVLFYLARSKSNKVIARLCNISDATLRAFYAKRTRRTAPKPPFGQSNMAFGIVLQNTRAAEWLTHRLCHLPGQHRQWNTAIDPELLLRAGMMAPA